MSYEDHLYHREREQQCRKMAKLAHTAEIRRRHEELALLHADRASRYGGFDSRPPVLRAI